MSSKVASTCDVGIGARCVVNCKLSLSLCSLVGFQLSSWLHDVSSVAAEEMSILLRCCLPVLF